jgi:hypothetical protein
MNNDQKCVFIFANIIYLYYDNVKILKQYYLDNKKINNKLQNFLIYFHNSINDILKFYDVQYEITLDETHTILNVLLQNHIFIKRNINKIHKIHINCINKLNNNANLVEQNGGFFYNKYDSIFTKILNVVDILIDFISILPKHILFDNDIIAPFQIFSGVSNLMRGNFVFAFYSFITLIPGIGNTVGAGSKIIYRLIDYIYNRIYEKKQIIQLNNIENMKKIYKLSNFDPIKNYINENLNDIENEDLLIGYT